MNPSLRRGVLFVASVAIAAVLLYLSFAKLDLGEAVAELKGASLPLLALAVVVRQLALLGVSLRSRILLAPMHEFGIYRLYKSVLLAFVVQNVIPLRAGEVARVAYLARHGSLSASSCLAVVAAERLVDLLVLLALFAAVLPAVAIDLPVGSTLYLGLLLAAGAVGTIVLVSKHPARFVAFCRAMGGLFGKAAEGFVESKSTLFAQGLSALGSMKAIVASLTLSAFYWLCSATSVYLWLRALGLDLGWQAPVVVLAFLALGLAVPTTPGNIGTYHFLAFSAAVSLGVDETQAGSFALLGHAMSIVPATIIGVLLLFGDFSRSRREAAAEGR